MYRISFSRSFLKDIKKISKEVQKEAIEKWIPKIQEDPYIGTQFSGPTLKDYTKISFRYKKSDYRIVYKIHKKEISIIFLAIGSRENFYKKISRRF